MPEIPNTLVSWTQRRIFMYVVNVFCMAVIGYVLIADKTSGVADTAVTFAFLTIAGTTGSYVFGAVWQAVSVSKNVTVQQVPQPEPVSEADK